MNLPNQLLKKLKELNDKVSIEFENEEKGNRQLKKPCSNSKLIDLILNKLISVAEYV